MENDRYCVTVEMEGILQGVGFRPTIQRLASEAALAGWVQNRSGTVRMRLAGSRAALDAFLSGLAERLPPRARLDSLEIGDPEPWDPALGEGGFRILESSRDATMKLSIPADLAMCEACHGEVFDPASRFYGYPFTTCTDCGPRYTVVNAMPYDRERTTLAAFPLCARCRGEYTDPRDRRFHAESIACPDCGPRVWICDAAARELDEPPIAGARRRLARGEILAVRGLGGFLLAADAFDAQALARLRERKHRPHKPFAIMARDLETLARYCEMPAAAEPLLAGPVAPIVILEPCDDAPRALPIDLLSPDTGTLGSMVPTTPLHALLFEPLPGDPTPPFELLVMTSGNRGGEPICISNEEAFERLEGIADAFLVHDRPVNLRNDDSLVAMSAGAPQVWRRARGYAPESVPLPRPLERTVLAMGAELKNTVALGFGREIVPSPHVGDLETPEALDGLEEVSRCLPDYLAREPDAIAVDLHPDMHSTRLGRRLAGEMGVPVVEVQHHHAHAAAGLVEARLESALALVFDGTGLGPDGTIWGAEALLVHGAGFERVGSFVPAPLPGGDAAVLRPARQTIARWLDAGLDVAEARAAAMGVEAAELAVLRTQVARGLNAPATHAAGRVFDAFSAAIGASPRAVSYEGQAAIRLEAAARRAAPGTAPEIPFETRAEGKMLWVDWRPAFEDLAKSRQGSGEVPALALAFHEALARAALAMAAHARGRGAPDDVLLTGGVFMNRLLTERLVGLLGDAGWRVHLPRRIPPNDGGIALGQAWIAGGF